LILESKISGLIVEFKGLRFELTGEPVDEVAVKFTSVLDQEGSKIDLME